jgi:hypothetical protein
MDGPRMTITTLDPRALDELKPHPIADLFPPLTGDDYLWLHADIARHGIPTTEPVTLYEGMILAGRARVGVARQLRISCPAVNFEDTGYAGTPLDYAIAGNCIRGHYTVGQRIMIAARIANMRQGERTDLEPSAPGPKVSQEQAAQQVGVGVRSVTRGRYILDHGTPEEIEAAVEGKEDPRPLAARIRRRVDGAGDPLEPEDNTDRAAARVEEALETIGVFRRLHVDILEVVTRLENREQWDRLEHLHKLLDAYRPEQLFAEFRTVLDVVLDRRPSPEPPSKPKDEPEVEARRRRGNGQAAP